MQTCIEARDDAPRRAPRLDAMPAKGSKVYLQTLLPTRCLPLPVRRDVDEFLYVLHGDIDVWIAGRHARLRPGMSAVMPRDVECRSGNFGSGPAKVLIVASTGDNAPAMRRAPAAAPSVAAVLTSAGVDVAIG